MTDLSYFDDFCKLYQPYKRGSWCYEDGCIYRGLILLHRSRRNRAGWTICCG